MTDFHFSLVHMKNTWSRGAEEYRGGMNVDVCPTYAFLIFLCLVLGLLSKELGNVPT